MMVALQLAKRFGFVLWEACGGSGVEGLGCSSGILTLSTENRMAKNMNINIKTVIM